MYEMIARNPKEFSDVLERVRTWPPGSRIALARQVLETLERPEISEPPRTLSLDDVIGLLRTDAQPPDDQQCQQIIEEERTRKYG
jgi:hypothetical protein